MSSIFSRIIQGEIPADVVYEDDQLIVIKDIAPVAPVHLLLIPKKEIADLQSLQPDDFELLSQVVAVAQELAEKYKITKGYRLLTNNGSEAGQTIFHLHFHLIGGRHLGALA